jgi:hypothetical protein
MRRQPFEADFWRKMVDHQNWRGRHKPPFEARFDPLLGRDACAALLLVRREFGHDQRRLDVALALAERAFRSRFHWLREANRYFDQGNVLAGDDCVSFAAGLDIGPRSARLYWTDEDAAILTARADRIADIAADRPAGHSYLATLNL